MVCDTFTRPKLQTISMLRKALKLASQPAVLFGKVAERLNRRFSSVGDRRFFDQSDFPWVESVEKDWPAIRSELDKVLALREGIPNFQDISVDQKWLTSDEKWKTFFFHAYGIKQEQNCAFCPATASALEKIPGLKTAFFSILMPEKRIPPHRGPYNGVLRYHLAVKVPGDGRECGIDVGGDVGHWVEGKSLVFDDSYMHHAWNNSDDIRVVLFVDFVRPLPIPFDQLNRLVIRMIAASDFVQSGLKRQKDWDERFANLYLENN